MTLSSHQQHLVDSSRLETRWQLGGMLTRIELEIITACNLRCYNCDRSSRQAVSGAKMSVAQVARFVDESVELDWRWDRITLLGGEPTLHPDLPAIVEELGRYRTRHPDSVIGITSNGYGSVVRAALDALPPWVKVRNTRKLSIEQPFDLYNVAPVDLDEYRAADFSCGCAIPFLCGMGLTPYGFYPCGAGASVDRIFGYDCGIKSLRAVTPDALVAEFSRLCRSCGHFHGRKGQMEVMSPSWIDAYEHWHRDPPRLTLYGEEDVLTSGDQGERHA